MEYLSTVATWATPTYYVAGILNTFVKPSFLKYACKPEHLVKEFYPEIFEKVQRLRDHVLITRALDIPYSHSCGTNFSHTAILLINDQLPLVDSYVVSYMLKYELCHIKMNDNFVAPYLAVLTSTISTFAVPYLKSCLPLWAEPISYCVPILTGINTYNLVMDFFEFRADAFAFQHATNEELAGIVRFMEGEIEVNKAMHVKYPRLFTKKGNTYLPLGNITHLSLTRRIERVKKECFKKNISLSNLGDQGEKMQKIKEFHRGIYAKFFKLKVD